MDKNKVFVICIAFIAAMYFTWQITVLVEANRSLNLRCEIAECNRYNQILYKKLVDIAYYVNQTEKLYAAKDAAYERVVARNAMLESEAQCKQPDRSTFSNYGRNSRIH
jgi:hypothetical protein